jgi:hypothetical protein
MTNHPNAPPSQSQQGDNTQELPEATTHSNPTTLVEAPQVGELPQTLHHALIEIKPKPYGEELPKFVTEAAVTTLVGRNDSTRRWAQTEMPNFNILKKMLGVVETEEFKRFEEYVKLMTVPQEANCSPKHLLSSTPCSEADVV